MVAQAAHIPVHLGAMPESVRAVRREQAASRGDVFILNDPYPRRIASARPHAGRGDRRSTGRSPATRAMRAHHADVGGMSPGSMPQGATELVQEGIVLPPVRLVREGILDEEHAGAGARERAHAGGAARRSARAARARARRARRAGARSSRARARRGSRRRAMRCSSTPSAARRAADRESATARAAPRTCSRATACSDESRAARGEASRCAKGSCTSISPARRRKCAAT